MSQNKALNLVDDLLKDLEVPKEEEYEVIYWPMKSRGNFLRLILAEAGVPFKDTSAMNHIGTDFVCRAADPSKQGFDDFSHFAPPIIRKGDFVLSQGAVGVTFLASEFKQLSPQSKQDYFHAYQLVATANDMGSEVYGLVSKSVEQQKAFLAPESTSRLHRFLYCLNSPLVRAKDQKFYFDNKCTFADLAVFNVLDGLMEFFGAQDFDKNVRNAFPALGSLYDRVVKRDGVAKLLDSQAKAGYYSWPQSHMELAKALGYSPIPRE